MQAENTNLSYFRMRKIIGASGLLLPYVLLIGAGELLPSVSDYYYHYMGIAFTSALTLSGTFLIAYRGYPESSWFNDNGITTFGGLMIIMTAMVPTTYDFFPLPCPTPICLSQYPVFGIIHFVSAVIFFALMGALSYFKFTKSNKVDGNQSPSMGKIQRNKIYRFCAWGIWLALVLTFVGFILRERTTDPSWFIQKSVFFGEFVILQLFGVAWLVKGKALKDMGWQEED